MNEMMPSAELVEVLCTKGSLTADDVLALRGSVFADGVITADEADAVFRLAEICIGNDPAWSEFYVDALTDHFVWRAEPRGYVSKQQGKRLIREIAKDGRIDQQTELELLINIIHRAISCPAELVALAIGAVRDSVLSPETAAYGSNRPPAMVSAGDVAIIRTIIYGPGGEGGITITRNEAEMIFDLNEATRGQDNAPEWRDLFVNAIAAHLMFPRGAPRVPTADEAKRREAWLDERRGVGQLLSGVGQALARGDIPFAEAWREIDPMGWQRAREEQAAEERRVREAAAREAIDAAEAKWLVRRIERDGVIDDNERGLLDFIRRNSPSIDAALVPLMERAGV